MNSKRGQKEKLKRIRDIFETKKDESNHFGILIYEFCHNSTNAQALNQEYAIIDAIQLDNLTNIKREKFSLAWPEKVNAINYAILHLNTARPLKLCHKKFCLVSH